MKEKQATFRFYAELNDFLPVSKDGVDIPFTFQVSPSIKDAIESLGVPHAEINYIQVNGEPVSFTYRLASNDRVSVYPTFRQFDIPLNYQLQPQVVSYKFMLDVHLGKLAKNLRMLGFDAYYHNNLDDNEIIALATDDARIILTRDIGLLKNSRVKNGYWVRSVDPNDQMMEIIYRFDLASAIDSFHRCLDCNSPLKRFEKDKIGNRLREKTKMFYNEFFICEKCDKIFWKGSHYHHMRQRITEARAQIQRQASAKGK